MHLPLRFYTEKSYPSLLLKKYEQRRFLAEKCLKVRLAMYADMTMSSLLTMLF